MLANAGEVLAIETIAKCMAHPLITALFLKVQTEEIGPTVRPVPDMTPLAYVDLIKRRFSNARIIETTRYMAFDGSVRHTGFVLPILRDQLDEHERKLHTVSHKFLKLRINRRLPSWA